MRSHQSQQALHASSWAVVGAGAGTGAGAGMGAPGVPLAATAAGAGAATVMVLRLDSKKTFRSDEKEEGGEEQSMG